ncbi:MAG TPA: ATP-dependent RecD-like DNA helicase [Opitutales bacterium]|nr:ATP-dependent RecD-like DNA helicase [Opitutales bacterium]
MTSSGSPSSGAGDAETVEVAGSVEKIVFSNDRTGFVIAELRTREGEYVTVKGVLPGLCCGESVAVKGRRVFHPSFGMQVEGESFSVRMPAGVEAMRKFLASGLVPGIGKGYAEKIVAKFGADTARVLSDESGRLKEIPGLGGKRASKIKLAWDEQRALREVMMFLQTYGVGVRRCMRIVKEYGSKAPVLLKNDPYMLARDIDGIGFRTADQIALNMGLSSESPQRLEAGIVHALTEAAGEGHTALTPEELVRRTALLLSCRGEKADAALRQTLRSGHVVRYGEFVQLPQHARAEEKAAKALLGIAAGASCLPPINVPAAIEWGERRAGFNFAPEQADAVASAIENRLAVITGGPGTGKTTILRTLVDILRAKKQRVLLASPTGRAAQRLSEAAGMEAATLHRLLKMNPESGFSGDNGPLEADMVIVDEVSMLDAKLAAALFSSIADGAHLLLVGDSDQLPSVGAGNVLADIIASGAASVVRLKSVFRQKEGSEIVAAAGRILCGDPKLPEFVTLEDIENGRLPEVSMLASASPDEAVAAVVAAAKRQAGNGGDPLSFQVLAPMHKGRTGIQVLNRIMQAELNPPRSESLSDFAGDTYRIDDKVICTRNNYERNVFNGDMGIVFSCDAGEGGIVVDFGGERVPFTRMELADLMHAYAISIHKSQGSEFADVVIPIMPEHLILLGRNLLYTAVTRARRRVLVVGSPDAWRMALSSRRALGRCTTLCGRIRGNKDLSSGD